MSDAHEPVVVVSADRRYLREHAPVAALSALDAGYRVHVQCLADGNVSVGREAAAFKRAGCDISYALPPARTAAGYTIPRLLALPEWVARYGGVLLLDADTYVRHRVPFGPGVEISLSRWPWALSDEAVDEDVRHWRVSPEWIRHGKRINIAGGVLVRGPGGARFARAIRDEMRALVRVGSLDWFADQVAVWRAFAALWPPAEFRDRQTFGLEAGLADDECPLVHPHPYERDASAWRDLAEPYVRRMFA